MFDADDREAVREAFAEMRADWCSQIVLRRDTATLTAQSFRVAQAGRAARNGQDNQTDEISAPATLLGDADADILPGDRFTHGGLLYVIQSVRPDRRFGTLAYAIVTQG